jgi:hypothetical protein
MYTHTSHPEMALLLGEWQGIGKEALTTAECLVSVTKHTIPTRDRTHCCAAVRTRPDQEKTGCMRRFLKKKRKP